MNLLYNMYAPYKTMLAIAHLSMMFVYMLLFEWYTNDVSVSDVNKIEYI